MMTGFHWPDACIAAMEHDVFDVVKSAIAASAAAALAPQWSTTSSTS